MFASFVGPDDLISQLSPASYSPDLLTIAHRTRGFTRLEGLLVRPPRLGITGTIESSYVPHDHPGAVPYLTTKQVDDCIVRPFDCKFITKEADARWKKCRVEDGAIVINKSGRVGTAGLLRTAPYPYVSSVSDVINFRVRPAQCDPYFLVLFLNTEWSLGQLRRTSGGSVFDHVSIYDVPELRVPTPDPDIQRAIGNKLRKAERLRELGSHAVRSARRDVESVVAGLEGAVDPMDWLQATPATEGLASSLSIAVEVTSKWPVGERQAPTDLSVDTHRDRHHASWVPGASIMRYLSAQSYRPAVLEALRKLTTDPRSATLRSICSRRIDTGVSPDSGADMPYIKTRNVGQLFTKMRGCETVSAGLAGRYSRAVVDAGAIVINRSGAGSIGRCAVYEGPAAVVSHHTISVVVRGVDPHYVAGFLSSWLGQRALERAISGSTGQLQLDLDLVRATPVPLPKPAVQAVIGWKLRAASHAFQEADRAILHANTAVEALIDGTLDDSALLAESDAIERWLAENPSPSKGA